MPLVTLSSVDVRSADAALAAALLSLGSPYDQAIPEKLQSLTSAVLVEARSSLKIDDVANPAQQAKLRAFLAKEASSRLTAGQDMEAVADRLGNQGALPLGAYKVSVGHQFNEMFKFESRKLAISVVRDADLLEHIVSSNSAEKEKQSSIFAKFVKGSHKRHSYWAIASALREGQSIIVHDLHRLFPETVQLMAGPLSPMLLLESFLETYGLDLSVEGGEKPQKIVRDRKVMGITPNWTLKVINPSESHTIQAYLDGEKIPTIVLGFAINDKKYRSDFTKFS